MASVLYRISFPGSHIFTKAMYVTRLRKLLCSSCILLSCMPYVLLLIAKFYQEIFFHHLISDTESPSTKNVSHFKLLFVSPFVTRNSISYTYKATGLNNGSAHSQNPNRLFITRLSGNILHTEKNQT
jgi:hypothetical protein